MSEDRPGATALIDREGNLIELETVDDPGFRWTAKSRRFVRLLARLGNAGEAAIRAGYSKNFKPSVLTNRPTVRAALAYEIRQLADAELESAESIITRASRWANINPGDYFVDDWQLKAPEELSEDQAKCIKKVKRTVNQHGVNIEVEFHDAMRANEQLARILGLLGPETDSQAPDETARAIKRYLSLIDEADGLAPQEPGSKPTAH